MYTSKNMQRLSYSHDKFLDREREKKRRQSPEYYQKQLRNAAEGLLDVFFDGDVELQEEIEGWKKEDGWGEEEFADVIRMYEELIQKIRMLQ